MDRSYASKCLAKALAYAACGKNDEAAEWVRKLIKMFRDTGICV